MRIMKNSKSALVNGLFLVVLVGLCLAPSFGMAREEISVGGGGVQGDPGDALGGGGMEGDPVDGLDLPSDWRHGDPRDGLDEPVTRILGDPGDGMDFPGDPGDALELTFISGDPGDAVLRWEVTMLFGYFWIP